MLQNMPLVGLLPAFNTGKVTQSRKQHVYFRSIVSMLRQTLFELWNCCIFIVKQWQSKIFEVLGSTWIFSESRERNLKNTYYTPDELLKMYWCYFYVSPKAVVPRLFSFKVHFRKNINYLAYFEHLNKKFIWICNIFISLRKIKTILLKFPGHLVYLRLYDKILFE